MKIKTLVTLAILTGSSVSMATCLKPEGATLPKGATSSMEDMIAGQTSVKKFQAENIAYMGCLEKAFNEAEAGTKDGTDQERAAATVVYEKAVKDYNDAVSKEEEVAGQFNTEIREYKAAHPS